MTLFHLLLAVAACLFPTDPQIPSKIAQLGSPQWRTRQAATAYLANAGWADRHALREAAAHATDCETAQRLCRLMNDFDGPRHMPWLCDFHEQKPDIQTTHNPILRAYLAQAQQMCGTVGSADDDWITHRVAAWLVVRDMRAIGVPESCIAQSVERMRDTELRYRRWLNPEYMPRAGE